MPAGGAGSPQPRLARVAWDLLYGILQQDDDCFDMDSGGHLLIGRILKLMDIRKVKISFTCRDVPHISNNLREPTKINLDKNRFVKKDVKTKNYVDQAIRNGHGVTASVLGEELGRIDSVDILEQSGEFWGIEKETVEEAAEEAMMECAETSVEENVEEVVGQVAEGHAVFSAVRGPRRARRGDCQDPRTRRDGTANCSLSSSSSFQDGRH
ncbi:hypothetical protein HOY82DRAFT_603360 [Tuber indicum]|nr:hypothetical protein HOY82DRAFT_603360 [Tuber indicum]